MPSAATPDPTAAVTTVRPLTTLHVVGGEQRRPAGMRELDDRWYGYGRGVIVEVDGAAIRPVAHHVSETGTHGDGDPILFKSASVAGDRLYACSQTELMVFDHPTLERRHHISHPLLNDVHHVIPVDSADPDGNLLAAVSGQDLVAEFTVEGEVVSLWGVDGSDPGERIDPQRDYRIACDTKPHAYHPNHLFRLDGDAWVTRFETRDAVQVGNLDRRIAIDRERCHDGVVHDGRVWFTTVDGHVVAADAETLEIVADHELAGVRPNTVLGWCRGLAFIDGLAVVGFSRIRHTKVRGTLSWIRNGLSTSEPTRIAFYDPKRWDLLGEVDLEPAGCNAVFSIVGAGV